MSHLSSQHNGVSTQRERTHIAFLMARVHGRSNDLSSLAVPISVGSWASGENFSLAFVSSSSLSLRCRLNLIRLSHPGPDPPNALLRSSSPLQDPIAFAFYSRDASVIVLKDLDCKLIMKYPSRAVVAMGKAACNSKSVQPAVTIETQDAKLRTALRRRSCGISQRGQVAECAWDLLPESVRQTKFVAKESGFDTVDTQAAVTGARRLDQRVSEIATGRVVSPCKCAWPIARSRGLHRETTIQNAFRTGFVVAWSAQAIVLHCQMQVQMDLGLAVETVCHASEHTSSTTAPPATCINFISLLLLDCITASATNMAEETMDIDDAVVGSTPQPVTTNKTSEPRTEDKATAVRSVEGWVIAAVNVHEEASEEDINDKFGDFGDIKSIQMNLDRRSGFVKGYVFIEYSTLQEAQAAIAGTNGQELLEQKLQVDYAFVRPLPRSLAGTGSGNARGNRDAGRARSRSPKARTEEGSGGFDET
nr:rna-binding protein 8a [Quercus suber]